MKKLLSLPPNLVECFHDITGYSENEWFCTHDPVNHKLGSGGGSAFLLEDCYKHSGGKVPFDEWLASDRRLLLHAGGQSRRLPAYAPSGKILTPIPVFRWERGQRLSQNLLSLQIPFCQRVMDAAPAKYHTLIVSGDVYLRSAEILPPIPDADVVCYGLWLGPEIARNHGIFVSSRETPSTLHCMVQKPTVSQLGDLQKDYFYLTDIGVWLLSDRAVNLLMKRSLRNGEIDCYDLYSEFGGALGTHPTLPDDEVGQLDVAVVPLPDGMFYHYGTSHEIISSTLAVQNLVNDQREIMHHSLKPHPSMFIQNSLTRIKIREDNRNLWIENSCVNEHWTLERDHLITGVPQNDWDITLRTGQCVDMVPVGTDKYAVRPYGFYDVFRGCITDAATTFLGIPIVEWAGKRGVDLNAIEGKEDLQSARIFPVVANVADAGSVLRWMLNEPSLNEGKDIWEAAEKLSADDLSAQANLRRLAKQRATYRASNWPLLAENYRHSVFYQIDLADAAKEFSVYNIPAPKPVGSAAPLMTRIHDAMFRAELARRNGRDDFSEYARQAFGLLREGLTAPVLSARQQPVMSVFHDQIVWARSPVRIDLAGGWTDTPPFCLMEGGSVINMSVELNGQPPLQVYVKPCSEWHVVLRSIDLGASETVETYEQMADFNHVGSPFSIPKAALVLAGFQPGFSTINYTSLAKQLQAFGCGIELTLLSAIPAGSGLGTSSILAATVLAALGDFCGLAWDKNEIGHRTLVLEQMLTTGGGWQDQFGGIIRGVKLLQTQHGFCQEPVVRRLPDELFSAPEYRNCHLLYYTGITRTAKTLLAEIVRKMFLNQHEVLALLRQMKCHTEQLYDAIQRDEFEKMGLLIGKTWMQNQALDSGTNPPEVQNLIDRIADFCLGYKLPGAGGGGFLYMVAKNPEAAGNIKKLLKDNPLRPNARFVEMSVSKTGLQVSRS